jgi:hypothetical protein
MLGILDSSHNTTLIQENLSSIQRKTRLETDNGTMFGHHKGTARKEERERADLMIRKNGLRVKVRYLLQANRISTSRERARR